MTEWNTQLTFPDKVSRSDVVDFEGGRIMSDGGVVFLRAMDERLALTSRRAGCLSDGRDPDKVEHTRVEQLRQRFYQICCGYEDCNDAFLRADPALKIALDWMPGSRSPNFLMRTSLRNPNTGSPVS